MRIIKLQDSDDYILRAEVTFGHACDRNINGTCNAYKQHLLMEKTCVPFSQASEKKKKVNYRIIRACDKRIKR